MVESAARAGATGMLSYMMGIDEVGRGALAGPVVAAAFVAPRLIITMGIVDDSLSAPDCWEDVCDSKTLSPKKIAELAPQLCRAHGCYFGLGLATAGEIDAVGIVAATGLAMTRAVEACCVKIMPHECVISPLYVDGDNRFGHMEWQAIPHGDATIKVVSAASIIAKFYRDRLMREIIAPANPGYLFEKHVGYGTLEHRESVWGIGPCPEHRLSFRCPHKIKGYPLECGAFQIRDCDCPGGCWEIARRRRQRRANTEQADRRVAEQTEQMLKYE